MQANTENLELSFDYARAARASKGPLSTMSTAEIEELAQRYRKFLELKARHPEQTLAPTEIIDEMWHLHMLHPRAYVADCQRILGFILDHKPGFGNTPETRPRLLEHFATTSDLWYQAYGEPYSLAERPYQGVIVCADEDEDERPIPPKPTKPGEPGKPDKPDSFIG